MFNRHIQDLSESVDHYITNVIKLTEHCQYGELRDDLIRDMLVCSIRDDLVQENLLGIKDLSLTKATETLRANQAGTWQVVQLMTLLLVVQLTQLDRRNPEIET